MQLDPNSFNRQSAGSSSKSSVSNKKEKDQRLQEINQQFESITNQIEEDQEVLRSIYDKYEDNLYVMRIRARDGDPEAGQIWPCMKKWKTY